MVVYGKNVAKEVLDNNKEIYEAYISNSFDDKDIIDSLNKKNIKIKKMDRKAMDNKFGNNNQGIALEIEDFKYKDIKDIKDYNFVVMLDHLEDPHNLGAIIRTCEAAGVKSVIIPKNRQVQITATVMKTNVGTLNNVNVIRVSNLNNAIDELKGRNE